MFENILIGLGTGLVAGLITGYYSGLIITRRSRFDSLLADLQRHLNSVSYMDEDGVLIVCRGTSEQIIYVGSELAHFKHKDAASHVWGIGNELGNLLMQAGFGNIKQVELEKGITKLRQQARETTPSKGIYLPWGRA